MNFGTPQEMIDDEIDNNPNRKQDAKSERLFLILWFILVVIIGIILL